MGTTQLLKRSQEGNQPPSASLLGHFLPLHRYCCCLSISMLEWLKTCTCVKIHSARDRPDCTAADVLTSPARSLCIAANRRRQHPEKAKLSRLARLVFWRLSKDPEVRCKCVLLLGKAHGVLTAHNSNCNWGTSLATIF